MEALAIVGIFGNFDLPSFHGLYKSRVRFPWVQDTILCVIPTSCRSYIVVGVQCQPNDTNSGSFLAIATLFSCQIES